MGYRAKGFRLSALLFASIVLAPLAARAETLDQLYEKAKAEGALTIYTGAGPSAAKAGADAFDAIPIFYGYNPEKVKDADVPKSALDFLKPQFRGKVVPALYSPRRDMPAPAGLPPLTSKQFANDYRDFLGDGKRVAVIRKNYEALTGPVVNKATQF